MTILSPQMTFPRRIKKENRFCKKSIIQDSEFFIRMKRAYYGRLHRTKSELSKILKISLTLAFGMFDA